MSDSTYTCAACDSEMTFENFQKFGGVICVPLKARNDVLVFCLCEKCYHKSKRPSADELVVRMPELIASNLRDKCAFTTRNIIALNGGSLECALMNGHDCPELLKAMARTESIILLPS